MDTSSGVIDEVRPLDRNNARVRPCANFALDKKRQPFWPYHKTLVLNTQVTEVAVYTGQDVT